MTKTFQTADRFCIAKQYRRHGSQVWGVYDNATMRFVEGGFFAKGAAQTAAARWNRETLAQEGR